MKHIEINGDEWLLKDTDYPSRKPKELATNPIRYIHYPVTSCVDTTLGSIVDRYTSYKSGSIVCAKSLGLSRYALYQFKDKNPNKNVILLKWRVQRVDGQGLAITPALCGPNSFILEPNFNFNDAMASRLIIDDVLNILDFIDPQDSLTYTNLKQRKYFTLDEIVRCAIIYLAAGDTECSNGSIKIDKNGQIIR